MTLQNIRFHLSLANNNPRKCLCSFSMHNATYRNIHSYRSLVQRVASPKCIGPNANVAIGMVVLDSQLPTVLVEHWHNNLRCLKPNLLGMFYLNCQNQQIFVETVYIKTNRFAANFFLTLPLILLTTKQLQEIVAS